MNIVFLFESLTDHLMAMDFHVIQLCILGKREDTREDEVGTMPNGSEKWKKEVFLGPYFNHPILNFRSQQLSSIGLK